MRWKYGSERPLLAAVTTTGSGLVFTGELSGHLLAINAADGKVVARLDTGLPLLAGVITYAIEGRQFVAVTAASSAGFWRVPQAQSTVMLFALP